MARYEATGEEEGLGLGVGDVVAMLRRRRGLIVAVTAAAALLACVVALMMPTRFEAVSVVQIDPRKRTIVNLEPVTSELKADAATIDSEIEVIRSAAVLNHVIEKLELRADPEMLALGGPARGPGTDPVMAALLASLKVVRVRSSQLIEIKAVASSAEKAAAIANAVAEAYVAEQLAAKIRDTSEATRQIELRLQGLREKLGAAERRIADFKAENSIFDSDGQLLSEKQIARLMEQTVLARNATAEAKAKRDQLVELQKRQDGMVIIADVLASHTVRMLKEQYVRATRREAELATRYGALHPEIIKARAEVADVRGQINREVGQIIANVETDFRVVRDREAQLQASLSQIKARQIEEKAAVVILRDLEREASTSRQVFEAFLGRYKQTMETQGLETPDSRVIQPAAVPLTRAGPKRLLIGAGGLALGLVASLGLALLLELMRGGVRRPEDVERDFEVEHLVAIPAIGTHGQGTQSNELRALRLMLAEPGGAFAAAIRTLGDELGVRLQLESQAGRASIVLVASAMPGEGRTEIAANLALHFALMGRRTLLVDGDLRRRHITTRLGLGDRSGLHEAVALGTPLDQAIVRDHTSGLYVLPASGGSPSLPSPSQALGSSSLGEALERLRPRFDVIIMEAAPLLPVVDGRLIARFADQVLLVAAWQRTPRELLRRAVRCLGAEGERIIGAVMSELDASEAARLGLPGMAVDARPPRPRAA